MNGTSINGAPHHHDVVIVGAGFAGLDLLHKLRQMGLSAHALEAGSDIGGTWFWNRYPGARCDIESMQYSFSFDEDLQQEWVWSERFAQQPEILAYANHVAERFDPRSHLGLMSHGFPNLFTITGPGSPSVLSNVIVSIEQHVDWIARCLETMRTAGVWPVEATQEAEDTWVAHVSEVAHGTLYPSAASWYMGANIPGKPRVFLPYVGGVDRYRKTCNEIATDGYRGFDMDGAPLARASA